AVRRRSELARGGVLRTDLKDDRVPGRRGELTVTGIASSAGHYGFRQVAGMEWIKLCSLRSTWLTMALTVAAALGIGATVGAHTKDVSDHPDLTNNVLGGIAPGLLQTGVLGVLCMTSEYTSGMVRTTLAAAPNRLLLLTAKTATFAAVAFAPRGAAPFTSLLGRRRARPGPIPPPRLAQP